MKQIVITLESDSSVSNVKDVPHDIEVVFLDVENDELIAIYGEGDNNIIEQKI